MTTWIHPEAHKWESSRCLVVHQATVAFVPVQIISRSFSVRLYQQYADAVQSMIDHHGWLGTAVNNLKGEATNNLQRHKNGSTRRLDPGANGLLEFAGSYTVIIWKWEQVLQWLTDGWPHTSIAPTLDAPPGTWALNDGSKPDQVLSQCAHTGWPHATKQLRSIGIHPHVAALKRPLDQYELVYALSRAIKAHRTSLTLQ